MAVRFLLTRAAPALGVALLCLATTAMGAEPATWLTITGDPLRAEADTVQVDPTSIVPFGDMRTMRVRASRVATRKAYDGLPYRSYLATVVVDCSARNARFRGVAFYPNPLWRGAERSVNFSDDPQPRPMVFNDMQPNPTERIVQAACLLAQVQSR